MCGSTALPPLSNWKKIFAKHICLDHCIPTVSQWCTRDLLDQSVICRMWNGIGNRIFWHSKKRGGTYYHKRWMKMESRTWEKPEKIKMPWNNTTKEPRPNFSNWKAFPNWHFVDLEEFHIPSRRLPFFIKLTAKPTLNEHQGEIRTQSGVQTARRYIHGTWNINRGYNSTTSRNWHIVVNLSF